MAKNDKKTDTPSDTDAVPLADVGPASVVVEGPAAHDALAYNDLATVARIPLAVWLSAKRARPVDYAGFLSWAGTNAMPSQTSDEWAALLDQFQTTPIK
jgi:hypothetical protein